MDKMSKNGVVYIVKGKHIQLLAVSLSSLVKNYKSSEQLDIIIIEDITIPKDKNFIKEIPTIYGKEQIKIIFDTPPKVSTKLTEVKTEIGDMTLWRLFVPLEYPKYEKILYLDNDTIIYTDINEYFEQTASDKLIGAVQDFYFYVESDVVNLAGNCGLANLKNYVNAGVVVFNVNNYITKFSENYLLDVIFNNIYPWPDQTILNRICENEISYLPLNYNYQKNDSWLNDWAINRCKETAQDIVKARANVKLRHFIEYERFSMPWEHLHIADEFEADFYEYLYFLKKYQANKL